MNRIILIGNGFDLAHGLKTTYNDFIRDFWENKCKEVQEFKGQKIYDDELISAKNIPLIWGSSNEYSSFKESLIHSELTFKNIFLKHISEKNNIEKWVDIEDEYYSLLKESFRKVIGKRYDINALNRDFGVVKNLLQEYLARISDLPLNGREATKKTLRIKHIIGSKIYSSIRWEDFSENALDDEVERIYKQYIEYVQSENKEALEKRSYKNTIEHFKKIGDYIEKYQIRNQLLSTNAPTNFDTVPENTLFLNFNYTHTNDLYYSPQDFKDYYEDSITKTSHIHIHGSIRNQKANPIIFGFGDELDEDYRAIEKLNDNKYLENIKSIKYSETANYKRLIEYVNSGYYQIFIMGHSCGISDRTLLNTVFEHDNCASIKVFYHQRDENTDNFSDIIRNISRNFNDKAKMRDRVVNKTFCVPLIS